MISDTNTLYITTKGKKRDPSTPIKAKWEGREHLSAIWNFAQGLNSTPMSFHEAKEHPEMTWLIYGAAMAKVVQHCWANKINFLYIDNQYLGNVRSNKKFHRVIRNHVHDIRPLIDRPADRLRNLQRWLDFVKLKRPDQLPTSIDLKPFRGGDYILLAPPSPKSFKMWDMDDQEWIANTVAEIKRYTNRPIVVREKRGRDDRFRQDTMEEALRNAHCLVTYNSVSAVEAVVNGVPAITLGPNAAHHVSGHQLSTIENPFMPDDILREKWMRHLSYSQFTRKELLDGTAWSILNE